VIAIGRARPTRQATVNMLLKICEVFGHWVGNGSAEAWLGRESKSCPFRAGPCNKGSIEKPLGICSIGGDSQATVVCPNRFLEGDHILRDAGRHAFGAGVRVAAVPEVRVLTIPGIRPRKIGKIDYMLAALDSDGRPTDFAALEVQAVYISGESIRPAFDHYMESRVAPDAARRPDFRSSAQKRLVPQLSLKVPIFRRWGKKFFVAVDESFFNELPKMQQVGSIENSEVTWLVYAFELRDGRIRMRLKRTVFTLWDEVMTALREGVAPKPSEMLGELAGGIKRARLVAT
jgi:hypothetical protein